jgi:hypothetical protein
MFIFTCPSKHGPKVDQSRLKLPNFRNAITF